jgi:membrane-bound lytic murein transglycosylase D
MQLSLVLTLITATLIMVHPGIVHSADSHHSRPAVIRGESIPSGMDSSDVESLFIVGEPISDEKQIREPTDMEAGKDDLSEEERRIVERVRRSLVADDKEEPESIPVAANHAVERHIKSFTGAKRETFARWLARANTLAPTITAILRKNGLPEDLVYLAMIESGLNMKAYSRAKASGPWQFIEETGERYGLRVDRWVDERRDLEKSTLAACRYLKDLFRQFGSWHLAAAGYNAGEGRVGRAIDREGTDDFWELRRNAKLPRETREYVPQLLAATIIANEPHKYGFLDTASSSPPYNVKTMPVPGGTGLRKVAATLGLKSDRLVSLNPAILQGVTPPGNGKFALNIPAEVSGSTVARSSRLLDTTSRRGALSSHHVRRAGSVAKTSNKYRGSRADLLRTNGADLDIRPRVAGIKAQKKYLRAGNGRTSSRGKVAKKVSSAHQTRARHSHH